MDPKLFTLLSNLSTAYRRGETIEPEMIQLREMLAGVKQQNNLSEKTLKIFEYIRRLKKPVTAHDISVRFTLAQSTSATHLRDLYEAGLLTKRRVKASTIWEVHSTTFPVAVPDRAEIVDDTTDDSTAEETAEAVADEVAEPTRPIWPTNPFKTSYPNVRGYDD